MMLKVQVKHRLFLTFLSLLIPGFHTVSHCPGWNIRVGDVQDI